MTTYIIQSGNEPIFKVMNSEASTYKVLDSLKAGSPLEHKIIAYSFHDRTYRALSLLLREYRIVIKFSDNHFWLAMPIQLMDRLLNSNYATEYLELTQKMNPHEHDTSMLHTTYLNSKFYQTLEESYRYKLYSKASEHKVIAQIKEYGEDD